MDIQQWVDLFGRPADDPQVRDAVAQAGVKKPLKIKRDELGVRADIPKIGMTIVFTDDSVLNGKSGTPGRPILSAVMAEVDNRSKKDLYPGALPHGLDKAMSREKVLARLGPPAQSNDAVQTDAWRIDGLDYAVSFAEDLGSIIQVSIAHPKSH
jgi:hypothetical protein